MFDPTEGYRHSFDPLKLFFYPFARCLMVRDIGNPTDFAPLYRETVERGGDDGRALLFTIFTRGDEDRESL
jgi:hypothetical protein